MTEKREETEEGYQLDLDETLSSWEDLAEEAIEAVEKKADGRKGTPAEESAAESQEAAAAASAASAASAVADDGDKKELREQLIRTLADFDNFRKRAEREKETVRRFALFDVLREFLGVFDNLERALAASGSAEDLKKGVEMIVRQFENVLRQNGVAPLEVVGQLFDPSVHEAVSREEKGDIEKPTVTAEHQRGYMMHERLLRPAMVTVAMPPAEPEKTEEPEETSSAEDAPAGE